MLSFEAEFARPWFVKCRRKALYLQCRINDRKGFREPRVYTQLFQGFSKE
jgi:hypothetical protein